MREDMCVPCGGGLLNVRVGAIIMKRDRFLMAGNDEVDYLYTVGGRIKFGETAEEAVCREVFEETGVHLAVDRLGFVQENYFLNDTSKNRGRLVYEPAFYFYMKTPEDFEPAESRFTEGDHEEFLVWVTRDEKRKMYPDFLREEADLEDHSVHHRVSDERPKIRRMCAEDLKPLHALLSDPEVMRYLEPPFTMERTEEFLRRQGLSEEPRVFAVAQGEDPFIGYVIYHPYDEESMELGFVLKKEAWGRGIASYLTDVLIERAAAEGKKTVIECVPEQEATKRIAWKKGFAFAGMEDGLEIYVKER